MGVRKWLASGWSRRQPADETCAWSCRIKGHTGTSVITKNSWVGVVWLKWSVSFWFKSIQIHWTAQVIARLGSTVAFGEESWVVERWTKSAWLLELSLILLCGFLRGSKKACFLGVFCLFFPLCFSWAHWNRVVRGLDLSYCKTKERENIIRWHAK